jgi:hypothetical protein
LPIDRAFRRRGGVVETFIKAVNAFNSQDWDVVAKLLHKNVVVYNVNHLNYILGYKAAMKYFRSLPEGDPDQFVPTTMSLEPGEYPLSVRGIALWTDSGHGHINRPIRYEFNFEPATFFITSLWSTHSH